MGKQIEILAPAGSYESLKAAVAAGADAVYIGGTRFGARAYADNLPEEELLKAIDYVHLHGRKIYLTINTLLKEKERSEQLYDYLLPYYKQGIDAVIVQDIGVLKFVKEQFPELPVHASTQMTITNVLGAKFLQELGAERVVTARELQLSEIEEITKHTDIEVECFVHGALCYCYSGQCLYSSLIGGRSGNRGQCAQPCRLPYRMEEEKEGNYILSLKDICTLEYIPELVEAGIDSFKIEGRMKKPEYVALVTAMYRKYLDFYLQYGKQAFRVEPKDREMLMDLYNRGGAHGGYYHTKNGREMVSYDRPNHAGVPVIEVLRVQGKHVTGKALADLHKGDVIELPDKVENYTLSEDVKKGQKVTFLTHKKQNFSRNHILNRTRNESLLQWVREQIIEQKIKEKIKGKLRLSAKECATLTLQYRDVVIEVSGEKAETAKNQPIASERVEKQMKKTGNTPFEFERLDIELDGELFVPMQDLNKLRRNALERLEEKILRSYRREGKVCVVQSYRLEKTEHPICLYVYAERKEQWKTVLAHKEIRRIYLDCNAVHEIWRNPDWEKMIEETHEAGKELYLAMPHIFRKETISKYEKGYDRLFQTNCDGVLVRNYESYVFLREHDYCGNIVTDHNLYQFNQSAKEFWREQKVESTTAPLELNFHELKAVGLENSELVVYGYFPMMISAQCVQKTTKGCTKKAGRLSLKDRYNKRFAVKNDCDYCYNVIYNTSPVVLTDQKMEITELNAKALRLHFTTEDERMVEKVLRLYEDVFLNGKNPEEPDIEFTRGHFKRGIK